MKKKNKKDNYLFYDFVKLTAVVPGLLWFRPKNVYATEGAKARIKGGALLISNHSGDIDPIIAMMAIWYRRHHFITTTDLFNTKIKRFLFEGFHCIEIDKENVSMNTLRTAIECLKDEKLVSIFPEGYLTKNEELQKFKSGVVLMAVTAKKPIVPIYIKKRKNCLHRQRVVIGEPINPVEICGGKMPSLAQMEEIAAFLREKESELKKIADNL